MNICFIAMKIFDSDMKCDGNFLGGWNPLEI